MPINKYNKNCGKLTINVDVNSALTAKTCASVVIEIIKYLSYQRLQIPYNYERLKYVVEKKKEKNNDTNESWQSKTYFKAASLAMESLDSIFKNINVEFEKEVLPNEVCILFGSSVSCAKEVYRISIPQSLSDHFHVNHVNDSPKVIRNVLKHLICSEDMQSYVFQPLPLTNLHILLRRKSEDVDPSSELSISDFFLPIDSLKFPNTIPTIAINLDYNPTVPPVNCCNKLEIFDDSNKGVAEKIQCDDGSAEDVDGKNWFRSSTFLKGFKASFVNGQSVCDFWIK